MDKISRKDLNKATELLRSIGTDVAKILADKIDNAEIMEALYESAYVESVKMRLDRIVSDETEEEFHKSNSEIFGFYLKDKTKSKLDTIRALVDKANERRDDICDYDDTTLPKTTIGRCENPDDHYENIGTIAALLTPEEFEEFDKIQTEDGWHDACLKFQDKLNPANQELELFLEWGSDESKLSKDSGFYCCKKCADAINENADGGVSCDVEMAE